MKRSKADVRNIKAVEQQLRDMGLDARMVKAIIRLMLWYADETKEPKPYQWKHDERKKND